VTRPGLLLALGLGSVLLAACYLADEEPLPTQDIVTSIPWTVGEETSYTILDNDDEVLGTGVLRIDQEDGQFRLSQHYQNPDFDDRSSVLVDPETLKPVEGERVITGEHGVLRIEVHYSDGVAEIERIATEEGKDEERRIDRLDVPEHAYDTGASLFLWRTIPMQVDYRVAYRSMAMAVVGKSQENRVTLRVLRQEMVEVPAGTFDAWRVEIRAPGGVKQTAWYAADSARRLLKYDNGQNTFVLESVKEE
jgi:hypothetical protein